MLPPLDIKLWNELRRYCGIDDMLHESVRHFDPSLQLETTIDVGMLMSLTGLPYVTMKRTYV